MSFPAVCFGSELDNANCEYWEVGYYTYSIHSICSAFYI